MTWLEVAQELPLGQKVRHDCPECGLDTNTNAAIVNHTIKYYSLYCNACGFNPISSKGIQTLAEIARIKELNEIAEKPLTKLELPDDYTPELPHHARLWLFRAGITEGIWRRYKVGYSKSLERVVLPVWDTKNSLIWYQCRALLEGQKPKYIQPSRYKGDVLFRSVGKGTRDTLVIVVEDILSAIRVGESFQAVSILGTKLTTEQASVLGRHTIGVWLDPDSAGVKGSRTIRRTLGLVTDVFDIQSEVDPKHLSNKVIKELVNDKYNKFKQRNNITDCAP